MLKRASSIALLVLCTASLVIGRLVSMPGYKRMSAQADLIVIATPTANTDLPGPTTMPEIASVDNAGNLHRIQATQVETEFHAVAVLKGNLADNKTSFKLLHLKLVDQADAEPIGAPELVKFTTGDGSQYLMFLKSSADGFYEPFNGQTDPVYSIEKLNQSARPDE